MVGGDIVMKIGRADCVGHGHLHPQRPAAVEQTSFVGAKIALI
jgi:hypothetical protein